MMKLKLTLSVMMLFAFIINTSAQHEKCAAVTNLNKQILKDPLLQQRLIENEIQTQEWLAQQANKTNKTNAVITIPVVFHIIHNGEAIGVDNNMAEATILYQLERLNEDFRRLNDDSLTTSHAFYDVQADTEIEFCLAQRDPSGLATTGITREDWEQESFTINEIDSLIKPATIWNRKDYLNIWCVNLEDPDAPGVDGYGTFPGETTDTTDGVVIANFAFGYSDTDGKTIVGTHEIGHYLNLNHIWGDDECGDDLVADTPPAEKDNSGCPTFPHNVAGPCSPGTDGEMFMNYMDYSDADCTVMFTKGQKDRMLATLATSRLSLTTSNACVAVEEPSSINETAFSNDFNLFPNPTNGKITIENTDLKNETLTILLYNQIGSLVKEVKQVNSFPYTMNVNELPTGVYSIIMKTNEKTAVKKIVVSK